MPTHRQSKQNLGTPRHMLAALGAAVALLVAMLTAGGAQAEVLTPHLVHPEAVAPHEASAPTVPDPGGAVEPEGSPSPADPDAAEPAGSPVLTTSPVADLPSGDGPEPKPAPDPGPCKRKPGYICPYFCPHDSLDNCDPGSKPIPLYTEPRQSWKAWTNTQHLCADNRPVAYLVDVFFGLTQAFRVAASRRDLAALAKEQGLIDSSQWEAYNMFLALNCQTQVEM
jgi:hypothetical protein